MPFVNALHPTHLILILLIVLVVFGAGKLGQVGGALGKSVKEFKSNVAEDDEINAQKALDAGEPVATTTVTSRKDRGVATVEPEPATTVTVIRPTERPSESLRREEI
ncbi:MAG: twin-arginine translocase TatA/TatE family subunit [Chloroflexota bacterium]|nr:twin-arginine translocase TatA/TatE family subunit [Chloroflexota bacterium]